MSTVTQSIGGRPILRIGRLLLRVSIAALFLFAAIAKLVDPSSFAQQIANYQLTPWPATAVLSVFLPALELCVGISLLLGRWESGALVWVAVLLTIFSGALLSAIVRGLSIDCGCFGRSIENTGTLWPLIRNLALLAITGFLWFSRPRERSSQ
ncbi:MAG: DoxX family membrane protein [Verrucomicrobia bacterium]|nr:DoxX family membrane protein [Verrucomicrobiota bacterium]MBV8483659.1 DoxX family membrane protein [Verrucomicrobiota bacterium]